MSWFLGHLSLVGGYAWAHAWLAGLPLVIGLLLAVPLGWLAHSRRWLALPIVTGTALLYTIPSLALFVLLPGILGTGILDPVNVVVALTIYTVALLVRTVADGLASVPAEVSAAAMAMGPGPGRRFFTVDFPLAVPVMVAGLRVAAVSNVSIVSVAALIGVTQLGTLFTDGFNRRFLDPIVVGIVACILLALAFDAVIRIAGRLAAPWARVGAIT